MIVRPVLVFVLTSTPHEFLALKITTKPRPQNRVEKLDIGKKLI